MSKLSPLQITNLNPDANIGASAWLVGVDGHRLLLDAGTHPRRDGNASLPLFELVREEHVDAIAISHCHFDHVGALPVALRYFSHARVMMTDHSYFIVERVLHNSVNVMTRQRQELGIREYPLYTHEEVDDYASVFQGMPYRRVVEWADKRGRIPAPTLEFFDAGHALGSAGVLVKSGKQSLFYSGDVCFHDQTILRAAQFGDVRADTLILETTRGAHQVPPGFTRQTELDRLCDCIQAVLTRKGCVLIPAFGLGRTQEILAALALLMQGGRIKKQSVYIGGLGRIFTEIYDLLANRTNRSHPDLNLTRALNLVVQTPKEMAGMSLSGGRIFVLTAGMMSEHTASHELAQRLAGDKRHGIFFVGYADPVSPGGKLLASQPGVPFHFSDDAGELTRRCQVEHFDLTAHANREDLLNFVTRLSPKTVVLGHGDTAAREWIAGQLRARHPHLQVHCPGPGQTVTA
jgi:Cft2 family RNA processing exonuclease